MDTTIMKRGLVVATLWATAACTDPQGVPAPGAAPAAKTESAAQPANPAPQPAAITSARAPDEAERKAMLEVLQAQNSPDRRVWFVLSPGQDETAALAKALASGFESAGWKTSTRELRGMSLKPGISVLAADEEPPAWVESAQEALKSAGLDPKFGTGYRAFFEEKKKENPAWPGIPMGQDEVFLVVLGPAA